jgi:hypothetical protein
MTGSLASYWAEPGLDDSLAITHWQVGDKPQARTWYDKAARWMQENQPKNEELLRFRAEAAALLEVNEKTD